MNFLWKAILSWESLMLDMAEIVVTNIVENGLRNAM